MPLHLLPEPKGLRFVKGLYALDLETLILLPATAGDQVFFAAGHLQAEIQSVIGLVLPIATTFAPPRVRYLILLVHSEEQAVAFWVKSVEIRAPTEGCCQAYRLGVQPGRIVLCAGAPAAAKATPPAATSAAIPVSRRWQPGWRGRGQPCWPARRSLPGCPSMMPGIRAPFGKDGLTKPCCRRDS